MSPAWSSASPKTQVNDAAMFAIERLITARELEERLRREAGVEQGLRAV